MDLNLRHHARLVTSPPRAWLRYIGDGAHRVSRPIQKKKSDQRPFHFRPIECNIEKPPDGTNSLGHLSSLPDCNTLAERL